MAFCTHLPEIAATMCIPADPHHVSLLVTFPSVSMMDFALSCLSGSLLRGLCPAGMQHNRQLVHFIVRAVRFTAWLPCLAASWYACPCGEFVSVCVSSHSLAWHSSRPTATWTATLFSATWFSTSTRASSPSTRALTLSLCSQLASLWSLCSAVVSSSSSWSMVASLWLSMISCVVGMVWL